MATVKVRWRPTQCKVCRRRERKNLPISARGLCPRCAANRLGESHEQMRSRSGPVYEKWRRNQLRAIDRYTEHEQAS